MTYPVWKKWSGSPLDVWKPSHLREPSVSSALIEIVPHALFPQHYVSISVSVDIAPYCI